MQTLARATFQLTPEVQEKLQELHQKGIDINEIILSAIKDREQTIKQEYGTKCSIKTCNKPSEELHHSQRFSMAKTHDPKYLAPLYKPHHILAHTMDARYQEKRKHPA